MVRTIQIMLVDDHVIVRQGLRTLLETEPDFKIVGEAGDGLEALRLVERHQPDILILDLILPSLNGLEVTREIRRRFRKTRIIILSMHESEAYVAAAMQNGACGYVLKCSTSADLIKAVRDTIRGDCFLSAPFSLATIEEYQRKTRGGPLDRYETLTPREREVFQLTAEGLTSAEIARRLFISPRTVEIHRSNLMRKTGLHSQTEVVRYAILRGIVALSNPTQRGPEPSVGFQNR